MPGGRGGSTLAPPPARNNQHTGDTENHRRDVVHDENAVWKSTGLFL
jgi:hypothetical protein